MIYTWASINTLSHLSVRQIPNFDEPVQTTRGSNYREMKITILHNKKTLGTDMLVLVM